MTGAVRPDPPEEDALGALDALADPTRRRLVAWLSEGGPATATALARRLPMTRQGVSKHLEVLAAAGVVRAAREGRDVRYRLQPGPITAAAGWMADVAAGWDERLEALATLVEEGP